MRQGRTWSRSYKSPPSSSPSPSPSPDRYIFFAFVRQQSQLISFQIGLVNAKLTSNNPSHSSRYKTDFLRSKPFQSIQNQLPQVQAIPVDTKPTSSGPRHSFQLVVYRTSVRFGGSVRTGLPNRTEPNRPSTEPNLFGKF